MALAAVQRNQRPGRNGGSRLRSRSVGESELRAFFLRGFAVKPWVAAADLTKEALSKARQGQGITEDVVVRLANAASVSYDLVIELYLEAVKWRMAKMRAELRAKTAPRTDGGPR